MIEEIHTITFSLLPNGQHVMGWDQEELLAYDKDKLSEALEEWIIDLESMKKELDSGEHGHFLCPTFWEDLYNDDVQEEA